MSKCGSTQDVSAAVVVPAWSASSPNVSAIYIVHWLVGCCGCADVTPPRAIQRRPVLHLVALRQRQTAFCRRVLGLLVLRLEVPSETQTFRTISVGVGQGALGLAPWAGCQTQWSGLFRQSLRVLEVVCLACLRWIWTALVWRWDF